MIVENFASEVAAADMIDYDFYLRFAQTAGERDGWFSKQGDFSRQFGR